MRRRIWIWPARLTALALLAAACGGGGNGAEQPASDQGVQPVGGAEAQDEPEETASTFGQFVDRADLPTVVYDGESCTYIGPEIVDPGPVRMVLDNRSGERARMDILRLPGDKNFDDLAAYVESGEAEANQDSPDWVTQTRKVRAPADQLIGANRTLFDNTYGILCYLGDEEPFRIEAVAAFEVLDA